jgi:hypothetical protein
MFTFLFILTGCVNNENNLKPIKDETNDSVKKDSDLETFIPQKGVPNNLPVYPGAILVNDIISYGENNWQWLYHTTASGNEIVDFFTVEFQNLGFEINTQNTFAAYEEFFVNTTNSTVSVYWLSIDELEGEVNPDTPGRSYAIVVNLNEWKE